MNWLINVDVSSCKQADRLQERETGLLTQRSERLGLQLETVEWRHLKQKQLLTVKEIPLQCDRSKGVWTDPFNLTGHFLTSPIC